MERTCECGKRESDFKNESGFRGHLQMSGHHEVSATTARAEQQQQPAAPHNESESAPEPTIEDRVAALERALQDAPAAMQQGAVDHYLAQIGAHPGLCASEDCAPCRSARAELGQLYRSQGRDEFSGELEAAMSWAGRADMADWLADVYSQWMAAGKPEPQTTGQNGTRTLQVTR